MITDFSIKFNEIIINLYFHNIYNYLKLINNLNNKKYNYYK